jgi:hypothetical protein
MKTTTFNRLTRVVCAVTVAGLRAAAHARGCRLGIWDRSRAGMETGLNPADPPAGPIIST